MTGPEGKSEHGLQLVTTPPPSPVNPLLDPVPLFPPPLPLELLLLYELCCPEAAQLARMQAPTRVRIPPPCKAKDPKATRFSMTLPRYAKTDRSLLGMSRISGEDAAQETLAAQ
jgi:hypothetical protein